MGSVVNAFTGGGGSENSGYQATTNYATLPFSQDQLNQANNASQTQLGNQQQLAGQLAAQNGLGTQNLALGQQQGLYNQLYQSTGNQQNVFQQQQALANQLQGQANGTGPNPALEQYKQNLNANTAAAAGTLSSQKGINPALAARMIQQSQGSANQNASSTEAQLQAQQQLSAQQQLAAQQQAMQGVAQNQINNVTGLQNSIQGIAANQVANQLNSQNAATQSTQNQQQNMLGAQGQIQGVNEGIQTSANAANAGIANTNVANGTALAGGLISGGAKAATAGATGGGNWQGGEIKNYAKGGFVDRQQAGPLFDPSTIPDHLAHVARIYHPHLYKKGGQVPGKPKVNYNSPKNDVVPAMLTPKEVVLPLSVTQSKNPPKAAAAFMQKVMDDKKDKPKDSKKHKSDFHAALADAVSKRKKK